MLFHELLMSTQASGNRCEVYWLHFRPWRECHSHSLGSVLDFVWLPGYRGLRIARLAKPRNCCSLRAYWRSSGPAGHLWSQSFSEIWELQAGWTRESPSQTQTRVETLGHTAASNRALCNVLKGEGTGDSKSTTDRWPTLSL